MTSHVNPRPSARYFPFKRGDVAIAILGPKDEKKRVHILHRVDVDRLFPRLASGKGRLHTPFRLVRVVVEGEDKARNIALERFEDCQ